jgi:hypothetical protein
VSDDRSTIYKIVPDGTAAYPVVTVAVKADQMVVDDKYLYWIDGSGFIGRVAK